MKTIAATKLAVMTVVTSVIALLSSCRNDFDFDYAHGNATESDIAYNDRFNELIGDIDPNHTWSTATSTQVYYDLDKTFDGFANIYSVSEKSSLRYFLGQIPVENGIITGKFDRPSTTSTIYYEAVDKDGYINKTGYVALDDLYQDATRSADFGMYGITRATRSADDISVASGSPFTATHKWTFNYTWEEAVKAGDQTACKYQEFPNYKFTHTGIAYFYIDIKGDIIVGSVKEGWYGDTPLGYYLVSDATIWESIRTYGTSKLCHAIQVDGVWGYEDVNGGILSTSNGYVEVKYNEELWSNIKVKGAERACYQATQDNYEFAFYADGHGYVDIYGKEIPGSVGRYNANYPNGYVVIDGNSKKEYTWTANFAHLTGIETEIDAPHTLSSVVPIVGSTGYLQEGGDHRTKEALKPNVNFISEQGPLDITFRYGATDHYDKFGYYFWKDGEDPLQATRYILMEDARPQSNLFWSEDKTRTLNGGMILPTEVATYEAGGADKQLYGLKYHVPYTPDGGNTFTYEWPAGVNIAFVMISQGANYFVDDNNMLKWSYNSIRDHNKALGQFHEYSGAGNCYYPEQGAYHAATIKVGSRFVFGFEDNREDQGDKDLNDIIFFVDGVTTSEEVPVIPPADPEPITTSYTVKYLDVDTNEEIATTKTVSDKAVGETAYESAISITDYTFNKSSVNGAENSETNRSITLVDGTNEIIFYYKKNSTPPVTPTPTTGNYVVHHYIKGTETKLFEDESGSGNVGSNVDVRAKSKDGYTFDTSKVGDHGELHNAVETITIIDGTIVVIFYYTPITYQSYIIACEDLGNSATSDFDYNDIVFEIVPMRDQKKVLVRPLAEGGTMEAYILFDQSGLGNFSKVQKIGPSGKEEVHKWLTGNASQSYKEMLNTGKSAVHNNAEAYEIVDESGNISMASNWDKYFCVLVNKDGSKLTGTEVSYDSESVVFSKNSASAAPRLLCISDNNWLWMQERVKIDEAYPNFCKWAANPSSSAEWYKESITSQDLYNFVTRRTVVEQVEETVEEIETPNAANTVLTITSGSTQTAITDPTEPTTVTEGEYPLSVESVSTNSRAMAPEWSFYVRESSDLANVKNGNILHIGKNEGSTQIFTLVAKYGDKDITSCKIRVAGEDGSALWAGEISPNGGWPGTKIDLNTTVLAHAMPSSEIWIYYKNGTDGNYLNIQYGTNPEYNQYGSFNWKKDANNGVIKVNLNNNIITYLKSHPYIYFQGEQNKYIITKVELK